MLDNEPHAGLPDEGGERGGATTPPGDTADSGTATRKSRPSRRKPAATAASSEAAGASADSAAPTTPGEPAQGEAAPGEAVPVKATRRRKKAAPPAAEAAPADAAPAEQADAAAPPAKATRSRRKKAAEPAAVPESPDPVDATVSPAAEAAPVKPARKSTARKAAPRAAVAETAAQPDPTQPDPTQPDLAQDAAAQDAAESDDPARRAAAAGPPAVLFMPPDPADATPAPKNTRRGRRGAPAASEESTAAETAAAGTGSEAATTETTTETPAATESQPESGRKSRRRRKGASDETASGSAQAPAADSAPPVLDEADESADDVEDGEEESEDSGGRRRRRRGRRGRGRGKGPADEGDDSESAAASGGDEDSSDEGDESDDGDGVTRRRRRRRRKGSNDTDAADSEDGVHTVVRVREPRRSDEVQGVSGSTRLEAKRQRRRDGREQRRTRPPILSESEFLARREAVDRVMVVRQKQDRTQIAVLEDGVLVEHYVARATSGTMVGNVYLGKVQNVLPSMEAAFVDVGRGRNAVLYAGEVNWDATGLEGRARSIEQAMRSGDAVLVQVTKDPIGHKGARLTSHIALSGRHLVYVPNGNASGISRKLPDNERKRLRDVLKKLVPDGAGVIVRTAAEGASEDDLARDVKRLQAQWEDIQSKAADGHAPTALSEEPDLVIRVVRDLFNEDFRELVVQGDQAYAEVESYLNSVSPDLVERLHRHTGAADVFAEKRIDEQILKGLDRKVFLPSGGHLVIDRTEAMTVVDVNTGKYTGAGGNLEETVTRNNLEAAEEIVRQLRLRDLGGIVVIDFIDMVLESNRELVLRRLTECLGRDRTKHQVTEITSLGLVQMTRKRIGAGLLEAFSETCDHCKGRGLVIHSEPVPEKRSGGAGTQVRAVAAAGHKAEAPPSGKSRRRRGAAAENPAPNGASAAEPSALAEPLAEVADAPVTDVPGDVGPPTSAVPENPADEVAGAPPVAGSGIITAGAAALTTGTVDDYDISGYDLSRYEAGSVGESMRLTGSDDPDAAGDDEDEETVGAGAGGRRRSRRPGTRRRTRP
ncbi:Rne/Rng family ribonuclease [Mangrovihabitans endophyticus]|uniref:Ribonuclease E n=1 Tax=Mangrovihabitans endophyticus TaxID=1751298 RepID=A0A8J3C661_9ACTN|nr:Rne/Rng family ribonuclease [Mangrovihabitans endophyticus]GGL14657.1 hypothetical protein GCM10012284_56740 [Mangrovihabitans endophyticus]